ncbi:MAG: antitoxin VapB family protein [Candidatus Micrarchaeota archaeon]|nr:antitoxin VapB family protein [Candidatus Micrarchaeota archaeon]
MSKLIAIADETYANLTRLKGKNKSFTEVINELLGRKSGNIEQFFGALKDKDVRPFLKELEEKRRKNVHRNLSVR